MKRLPIGDAHAINVILRALITQRRRHPDDAALSDPVVLAAGHVLADRAARTLGTGISPRRWDQHMRDQRDQRAPELVDRTGIEPARVGL